MILNRYKKHHIFYLGLVLLVSMLMFATQASAKTSSEMRKEKSFGINTYLVLVSLGLELNYYLDSDTQVGLVAGGDTIFVAGQVYANAHYTKFMGNSFFVRGQVGYWEGYWGPGFEASGPSTTVVIGHEWIYKNFSWGIEYGGIGAVFGLTNGTNLAFSFPHLKLGLIF